MVQFISTTTPIEIADGTSKDVREVIGLRNSNTREVSVALMKVPAGCTEPGQQPAFSEYIVVLSGSLWLRTRDATIDLTAGQAIIVSAGEWVQYGTPPHEGAEYITVCLPAFSRETVHRDCE